MANHSEGDKNLRKMASKGFRGYPIATVAFYGPGDKRATKVAVGIVEKEDADPSVLERWYSESTDARNAPDILRQILEFVRRHKVKSVVIADRILGCPHEEGKDYPMGASCPLCPFWENRDRFSGKSIH